MTKLEGLIDDSIMDGVRKHQGQPWKTTYVAVKKYRVALLKAQENTCAYCRRPIYRDEVGFRELDHILPKSQSPADAADFARAPTRSNLQSDRRNTVGYPEYCYEPKNLVISCKLCNAHKGTFDGLANRTISHIRFPTASTDYEWINLHLDHYSTHIDIAEGMIYKPNRKSSKGAAVIHACGLDSSEELAARVIDAYIHPFKELREAMNAAVVGRDRDLIDYAALSVALHARYQVGTTVEIDRLLRELRNEVANNSSVKLGRILESIGPRLGASGAIPPAPVAAAPVKGKAKKQRLTSAP